MKQQQDNLIWIDLEMTGLDTQQDMIIEIAYEHIYFYLC